MGIDAAKKLADLQFDYIEASISALQVEEPELFKANLLTYKNSPLPVKALNLFFPGDLKVVGPQVDRERVRNYVARVADALGQIGARIAVLGSGSARNIPEQWERVHAEEQFLTLLGWIGDEFNNTGVTLAIEPLNRKESNMINSVAEGVLFAKQINRPHIRVLADFYHMNEEQEGYQTLVEHKDWLAHIHIADTGRLSPGTGSYPYDTFAAKLIDSGYTGMISAECRVSDLNQELPRSLAYMKMKFSELK